MFVCKIVGKWIQLLLWRDHQRRTQIMLIDFTPYWSLAAKCNKNRTIKAHVQVELSAICQVAALCNALRFYYRYKQCWCSNQGREFNALHCSFLLLFIYGKSSNRSTYQQVTAIPEGLVSVYMVGQSGQGRLLMGGLGDGSPTISKVGGFATKGLHWITISCVGRYCHYWDCLLQFMRLQVFRQRYVLSPTLW